MKDLRIISLISALVAAGASAACNPDAEEGVDAGEPPPPDCAKFNWFLDADDDGYGDVDVFQSACEAPVGYVLDWNDCDDSNEDVRPNATDTCNGLDDNCDGKIDVNAAGNNACTDACTLVPAADGNGHAYLVCTGPVNRATAAACTGLTGMTLVNIDNAAENDFLSGFVQGSNRLWINAQYDTAVDLKWECPLNVSPCAYANWSEHSYNPFVGGAPSPTLGAFLGDPLAPLFSSATLGPDDEAGRNWYDAHTTFETNGYICERPPTP